ncbi:MAG: hypothetical protein Q9211_005840 [Gyalolechia sp. 1 TL-2023]
MAEPPAKRAKRTDSAAMWERNSKLTDTRDKPREPPRESKTRAEQNKGKRDDRDRNHAHEDRNRKTRSRSRERVRDRDRDRRRDRSRSKDRDGKRYMNGDRSRSRDRDGRRRREGDTRERDRSVSRDRHRSRRGESYNTFSQVLGRITSRFNTLEAHKLQRTSQTQFRCLCWPSKFELNLPYSFSIHRQSKLSGSNPAVRSCNRSGQEI